MKLALTLGAVMLMSGVASAQNNNPNYPNNPSNPNSRPPVPRTNYANSPAKLATDILSYERNQNADALLLAYGQAVTDTDLARAAITQLLNNFYMLRNMAQTPEQATQAIAEASLRFQVLQAAQNQVLIQQNQQLLNQNQQILDLLKGNAAKR